MNKKYYHKLMVLRIVGIGSVRIFKAASAATASASSMQQFSTANSNLALRLAHCSLEEEDSNLVEQIHVTLG